MLPHKNTPLRLQEVTVSPEFRSEKVKPKKKKKKKAEELLSTETARKILLKKKKKLRSKQLPEKEFKALVIRMLTKLGKGINEHSENFN